MNRIYYTIGLILLLCFPLSGQNFKFTGQTSTSYTWQHLKSDHEKTIHGQIDGFQHKLGVGLTGKVSSQLSLDVYMNVMMHKLVQFTGRARFPNQYPDFKQDAHLYNISQVIQVGPEVRLRYIKHRFRPSIGFFISRDVYDQTRFRAFELDEVIDTGMKKAFSLEENTGLRSQLSLGLDFRLIRNKWFEINLSPIYAFDIKWKNQYVQEHKLYSSLGLQCQLSLK